MENAVNNQSNIYIRDGWKNVICDVLALLFVILFFCVTVNQVMAFQTLKEVTVTSPLIGKQGEILAYIIPGSEIIVAALVVNRKTTMLCFRELLLLLILFTSFLIYMVPAGGKLPCTCRGVISQLSRNQHMGLNLILIALNSMGLQLSNHLIPNNINRIVKLNNRFNCKEGWLVNI